ncbi:hypothetical protein Shyhy01_25710 [Streptomyces hygroscopicus subsp. hygroscopicus]|nr:hypothetical protein Shyhy01_25710 [Streptomyces hygroscopicus subsp. hygroscopicus]
MPAVQCAVRQHDVGSFPRGVFGRPGARHREQAGDGGDAARHPRPDRRSTDTVLSGAERLTFAVSAKSCPARVTPRGWARFGEYDTSGSWSAGGRGLANARPRELASGQRAPSRVGAGRRAPP